MSQRHPFMSDEMRRNIASIDAVPLDVLPDDSSRAALRLLAYSGHDVYAYASGGETTGTWCVWLQPLADATPERNGRITVEQWRAGWRDYLYLCGKTGGAA